MTTELLWQGSLVLAVGFLAISPLHAQSPAKVPDDLKFSHRFLANAKNHLICRVSVKLEDGRSIRYQCDRYADLVRITYEDGTQYARLQGKSWLQSRDWGKTGTRAETVNAKSLDNFVRFTDLPFAPFAPRDLGQGGGVWKPISKKKEKDGEYFTFERTRVHPRQDAFYGKYTFVKYKDDPDGQLLLDHVVTPFFLDNQHGTMEIKYDYLLPLPHGTKIEVIPAR